MSEQTRADMAPIPQIQHLARVRARVGCAVLIAAALVMAVSACTSTRPVRYAMQVAGYIAASTDSRTVLQLALAERGDGPEPSVGDFSSVKWVTDAGSIPAAVDSVTSALAGERHVISSL